MRNNLPLSSPPALFVLVTFCVLIVFIGREVSFFEDLPVFSSPGQARVHVELCGEVLDAGVYQFNDGSTVFSVIKLTGSVLPEILSTGVSIDRPLTSGEKLLLVKNGRKIEVVHHGWIAASQRIALGIPLHPDRMTRADWIALPGIGEVLAERIELNRQKYGDFVSFEALERVKGIGKKRVSNWRDFFINI